MWWYNIFMVLSLYDIRFHSTGKYYTVNEENFARVLFLLNFAEAKFRENKMLAKWRNYLAFY